MTLDARERLIIALDLASASEAERLAERIGDYGRIYKIGYQLMPVGGIELSQRLGAAGKKVFLDFKFHDIGATVARGVASIVKLGGDFLTVHAEPDVLKGAIDGRGDDKRLQLLAVTVLTSLDQAGLARSGVSMKLEDLVLRRAEFAAEFGADGVIASPREAAAIKTRFGDRLLIVTPGVRPKGAALNDQARAATPAEAIAAGADYLVVGRPIVNAPDPKAAAQAIVDDILASLR